jgi:hypothetical protein
LKALDSVKPPTDKLFAKPSWFALVPN